MITLPTVNEMSEDGAVKSAIPEMPEFLQVRFREVLALQRELETLEGSLRTFPRIMPWSSISSGIAQQKRSHEKRISDLRIQITALRRIAAAVRLGYDPYTTPKGWWAGFVGEPYEWWDKYENWKETAPALNAVFNAPMPIEVLEKYKNAEKSGLFDHFVVVSPNPVLFQTRPAPLYCDPFLLGFIGTDSSKPEFRLGTVEQDNEKRNYRLSATPCFRVENVVGLEIAHWNLEEDRHAAGLSF